MKTENTNNWASYGDREAPYWRDGMTPDEYDEERIYFAEHFVDWQNGKYKPLWKQKNRD